MLSSFWGLLGVQGYQACELLCSALVPDTGSVCNSLQNGALMRCCVLGGSVACDTGQESAATTHKAL